VLNIIRALIICVVAVGAFELRTPAQNPKPSTPTNFTTDDGCGPYMWYSPPASAEPRPEASPKKAREVSVTQRRRATRSEKVGHRPNSSRRPA
jgi:hypothetical protein